MTPSGSSTGKLRRTDVKGDDVISLGTNAIDGFFKAVALVAKGLDSMKRVRGPWVPVMLGRATCRQVQGTRDPPTVDLNQVRTIDNEL